MLTPYSPWAPEHHPSHPKFGRCCHAFMLCRLLTTIRGITITGNTIATAPGASSEKNRSSPGCRNGTDVTFYATAVWPARTCSNTNAWRLPRKDCCFVYATSRIIMEAVLLSASQQHLGTTRHDVGLYRSLTDHLHPDLHTTLMLPLDCDVCRSVM